MANIKNFGLVGVGSDVQYGKAGPRLQSDAGAFKFVASNGTTYTNVAVNNVSASELQGGAGKVVTVDANGKLVLDSMLISNLTSGAGLAASGAYESLEGSNYLDTATSLKQADSLLDAAIKELAEDLAALSGGETGSLTTLQAEVNAIETSLGINADGTLGAFADDYYLGGQNGPTTIKGAIETLDYMIYRVNDVKLDIAGGTMTGDISMGGIHQIKNLAAPTASGDAVNKNYVDSLLSGLTWEKPVDRMVTDHTSETGLVVGQRVVNTTDNKIYTVKTADVPEQGEGEEITPAVPAVFDAGEALVDGAAFFFKPDETGYVFSGTSLVQFTGTGQIAAGVGLIKNGNQIDVNLGAGIAQLPTDEVGIDVRSAGGLFLTVDGSTASTDTAAQLAIKLNGTTLALSADGLALSQATIDSIAAKASQTELDATQTGAGLETDGTYTADSTTTYLKTANSLKDADKKLDEQIKTLADDLAALSGGSGSSLSALQTEVNTIETSLGLTATGAQALWANGNYFVAGSAEDDTDPENVIPAVTPDTYKAAIEKLDLVLKGTNDEAAAMQTAIGLNADGTFAAITGTNYLNSATTILGAVKTLDTQLKSVTDNLNLDGLTDVSIGVKTVEEVSTGVALAAGQTLRFNGTEFVNAALSSDDVVEGSTNLFFQPSRVYQSLQIETTTGTTAGLTYDEETGTFGLNANVASKKYVDDAIALVNTVANNVSHVVTASFTTADTSVDIGTVKGFVHRVKVYVTDEATASDAITVGIAGENNEDDLITADDIDSSTPGVYVIEVGKNYASNTVLKVFMAEAAAGRVIVEYI